MYSLGKLCAAVLVIHTSHGGDDRNGSGSRHGGGVIKLCRAGDAYMSSRDRDTGFYFLFVQVYERDFILFYFIYFSTVCSSG